ncbi:MAG: DUF6328 family protein, partial [Pseudomonadota bacterium]|nr:DUF6328 family protein [Pseudomonadota bacterium]
HTVIAIAALGMIVLAIALIMTPASYHRIVEPGRDTPKKIRLASRLVCIALLPLALGIAIDTFVVVLLASDSLLGGGIAGMVVFAILAGSWFGFPFGSRMLTR